MNKCSQNQQQQKPSGTEYDCPICKDTGVVKIKEGAEIKGNKKHKNGEWWYTPIYGDCQCVTRSRMDRIFKESMIPDEFKEAQFTNFRREFQWQRDMYQKITDYLRYFESIKDSKNNSFGFIAVFGEQNIRNLQTMADKAKAKAEHNNFGIGKTHLQIAAAKYLLNKGNSVLVVSDAVLMDELTQAKMLNDSGERLRQLLNGVEHVDVLVWDDIGKAKPSEAKESLYYQIVDYRYRSRKPIIFSSNEDEATLAERIGFATADRLIKGMAHHRCYAIEGPSQRGKSNFDVPDYRMKKG
ncbi:ATP-binding protein [Sporolactobacillus laevolacticus]|uniref:ATP-binding protein n=1 Tax=Sporolactobacillus laevolacticus DSM 442 TaxID=1395513 RepID=V6IV86_9BACL|nr:ATP-binding protein [Sporolactobacillus laevolacticus]EST11113.1 ATP-binding protein [Sporolactobacillus laevolacticus DSM 442]